MSTEFVREESSDQTIVFVNTISDANISPDRLSFEEIDPQLESNNCEVENTNSDTCDISQNQPVDVTQDIDKFRLDDAIYLGEYVKSIFEIEYSNFLRFLSLYFWLL